MAVPELRGQGVPRPLRGHDHLVSHLETIIFNFLYFRHLRDLAAGNKRIIKSDQVKVITIPQYEGLKVESILEFALSHR